MHMVSTGVYQIIYSLSSLDYHLSSIVIITYYVCIVTSNFHDIMTCSCRASLRSMLLYSCMHDLNVLRMCTCVSCLCGYQFHYIDVPPKQSEQQIEHSYASNAPSTSNQVSHDSAVGFTTLGTTGVRDQLKLLDANNREVGTATVLPGSILHGKNLPSNFIKIAIQHINPGVKPWPAAKGCFDEEELSAGTITGWPQESVIC